MDRRQIVYLLILVVIGLLAVNVLLPPPSPEPDRPFTLAGTQWLLESLTLDGVTRTPSGLQIPTLDFTADGQIGGTGGCNNFGGSYTVQGEILSIQEIRRTLMACMPSEIMTLEDAYLSALESARLFEKRDNQMSITFAEGRGRLLFQPR